MNNSIIHAKGVKEDLVEGPKHGDLSYVASKRKVPHGPDPIHNRFFIANTNSVRHIREARKRLSASFNQ
ncbi:unnamed protein product, partial [Brassica oleracea]